MHENSAPFRLEHPASVSTLALRSKAAGRARAVAIGNFDGAHRGHAALAQAARAAVGADGEVLALTFEPHPSRFFRPELPHFRLMQPELRARLLSRAGFDGAVVLPFDEALAAMSAHDFVANVLLSGLAADVVVVGRDFHFGKGRQGTPDFLKGEGERLGFEVLLVPQVSEVDGTVISSSAIRAALAAGDIARANALLGHPYTVAGEVIHGAKRGRELGYPTANIAVAPGFGLAQGVYAVRVRVDGALHMGAANFGTRPQFDNGAPLLETFLLDFSGDLYGKIIEVEFVAYLRAEAKFASLDALLVQMGEDCKKAREILSSASRA